MRMYVIFLISSQNYEKVVLVQNYIFFWKGLCFNYGSEAGLFECNLF